MLKSILACGLLLSTASAHNFIQSYKTEGFTAPNLLINKTGETEPGYLFFGFERGNHATPVIMSDDNELVWQGPVSDPHNFKVQSYKGKDVLTYFSGAQDPFGHGYGKVILVDNSYNEIKTLCLKDNRKHHFVTPNPKKHPGNDPNFCFMDYHESYITDKGTILVDAFNVTKADLSHFGGPRDGWIFDWIFFEIDLASDEILFQWSALDHIDYTKSNYYNHTDGSLTFGNKEYGTTQSEPWDFFHGNSVAPIDGGYLINSRMMWSCYKIHEKTGKVVWTLEGSNGGDFSFQDPAPFFSWEHMPRVVQNGDNKDKFQIHLFNNDNINNVLTVTNASSGYLLNVDTSAMTVSTARYLQSASDKLYTVAQGSYQALANDHVLLGYGTLPFIDEFDADNNRIFRAQFAESAAPKAPQTHSYRSFRQSWKGLPSKPPKVARDGDNVYASWNGATNYDSWNIYAGPSKSDLKLILKDVPKSGFETQHPIPEKSRLYTHFMAEATQKGRRLANSTVWQAS